MRGPNSQTRKCNYPIPLIEEVLVKQGGCHIFSKLDLKQAFFSATLACGQPPHHMHAYPIRNISMEGECNGVKKCTYPISTNDG